MFEHLDYVLLLGIVGQVFFGLRMLLQWAVSESRGRSVVTRGFWWLSLLGTVFMLAYAWSRDDLVFVLSLVGGLVVYVRNLFMRGRLPRSLLAGGVLAMIAFGVWGVMHRPHLDAPPLFAAVGLTGTLLWTVRFPMQWWVSERLGRSVLPLSFWLLTLGGGVLLVVYALWRADVIMTIAYAPGPLFAVRNLMLLARSGDEQPATGAAATGPVADGA